MSKNMVENNICVSAVIVSAGNSTRMGGINKQLLEINGIPVIVRSILAFQNTEIINEIIIVTRENDFEIINKLVKQFNLSKVSAIIAGGETRQLSVYNGVRATSDSANFIAIHDGARPLVDPVIIKKTVDCAVMYGAATSGIKVKDTVKVVDENNNILDTPDRTYMRFVQTPQVFEKSLYIDAVNTVNNSKDFTDDCKMLEAYGKTVKLIDGDYKNIKITTPEDIELAENYLRRE